MLFSTLVVETDLNTKKTQSVLSFNIELNKKRTYRSCLTFFIQADDTTNVAKLEDSCSTCFPIYLLATRTSSGNYFTTLRNSIKILH